MPSPDRRDVEVLDTGPPPSALRVWTEARLAGRGVRIALGVAVALVVGGALGAFPTDDPPPARGRESPTGPWRLDDDLAVMSGPRGHVVTFSAWNGGATPQDPADLRVVGGFVDRDDLEYAARCDGVDLDARGGPRFDGLVEPRYKVFVRCHDVTRYAGKVAWIDLDSITVRTS